MEEIGSIRFYFTGSSDDVYIKVDFPETMEDTEAKEKMIALLYGINTGAFTEDCSTAIVSEGQEKGKEKLATEIVEGWRDVILQYVAASMTEDQTEENEPCIKPSQVFRLRIT